MALHVMDEANRCLGCPKPRCQQGCPIHTDIPNVIKLLKAGKIDDAGKTLSIDDLFRDGYKAVFIGAGLMRAKSMHLKGESLGNVAFGIDFLANPKGFSRWTKTARLRSPACSLPAMRSPARGRGDGQVSPVAAGVRAAAAGSAGILRTYARYAGRTDNLKRNGNGQ